MNTDTREDLVRSEARLRILECLDAEPSFRLPVTLLQDMLALYGIARPFGWVRVEIDALEKAGAVHLSQAEGIIIATATDRGLDHVAGRAVLDGVKRPSPRRD
jgi:hypothetical protein